MTWKDVWFQTHWFVGITAGLVLALVGFTGALLSYEQPILKLLNPQLMTVGAADRVSLTPDQIIASARAAFPDKRVSSLTVPGAADDTARVVVNERSQGAGGPGGGGRRGTTVYVDQYTGAMLGSELRGHDTMHVIEDLHRRLAAGDTGKLIVGVSTTLLLLLAGTGLYLRWPKVAATLRTWFTFKWALKGRTFLWHLHAIVGTWVLVFYILASLTGLYWSFEWYRDGLFAMTGAPRPQGPGGAPSPAATAPGAGNAASTDASNQQRDASAQRQAGPQGEPGSRGDAQERQRDAASPTRGGPELAIAWSTFRTQVPAFQEATISLPRGGQGPLEIRYLDADAPHSRASNRLSLDAATGAVVKHERYADKPTTHKLMSSMFMLHSGGYFGWLGTLAMMLASLAMPLFAVTGWMLYLDRRRRKARARERARADQSSGYASEPT